MFVFIETLVSVDRELMLGGSCFERRRVKNSFIMEWTFGTSVYFYVWVIELQELVFNQYTYAATGFNTLNHLMLEYLVSRI